MNKSKPLVVKGEMRRVNALIQHPTLLAAQCDLVVLDYETNFDPSVVAAVAKAVTVAESHPEIETIISCKTQADADLARVLISGKTFEPIGGKWNAQLGVLEFPNGSAVAVKLEGG